MQGPRFGSVLSVAVTACGKQVDAQFLLFPHIADPWRNERLIGTVHTKADKLVALDVRRGDNVDNRLSISGILGRWVGDGLDTRDGVGGQGLEIGLQILLSEFRGFVVNPNLHARHTAQGDVAFHIHLHAGRVLQGVFGSSGLDGRVFADVVDEFLAVHGVNRFLGSDRDFAKRSHAGRDTQRTQLGVVGDMERQHEVLETDGRNT